MRALALGCFYSHISTGTFRGALTASVDGQLRGDKECPFSGVTKSGRVWRKVPESDAGSVGTGRPTPTAKCSRRTARRPEPESRMPCVLTRQLAAGRHHIPLLRPPTRSHSRVQHQRVRFTTELAPLCTGLRQRLLSLMTNTNRDHLTDASAWFGCTFIHSCLFMSLQPASTVTPCKIPSQSTY